MKEAARVVRLMKDRELELRIPQGDRCKSCKACHFLNPSGEMVLFAVNECDAKVGDLVMVEIDDNESRALSSLVLYGIPVLVFVLTIVALSSLLPELAVFLTAIALTALVYVLIHFLSKKSAKKHMPKAVKKLEYVKPSESNQEDPNQNA